MSLKILHDLNNQLANQPNGNSMIITVIFYMQADLFTPNDAKLYIKSNFTDKNCKINKVNCALVFTVNEHPLQ